MTGECPYCHTRLFFQNGNNQYCCPACHSLLDAYNAKELEIIWLIFALIVPLMGISWIIQFAGQYGFPYLEYLLQCYRQPWYEAIGSLCQLIFWVPPLLIAILLLYAMLYLPVLFCNLLAQGGLTFMNDPMISHSLAWLFGVMVFYHSWMFFITIFQWTKWPIMLLRKIPGLPGWLRSAAAEKHILLSLYFWIPLLILLVRRIF